MGSFLGVVVDRLYKNKSFLTGRSECEFCKHKLSALDLVPIVSFLILKGKCRYCGKKLSIFYPSIELLTGIAYFLIASYFLTSLLLFAIILAIVSLLIIVIFIDFKYGIIPDRITLLLIILAAVYLYFSKGSLLINIIVGIASLLFFLLISLVFYVVTKKESMGGADIKFAFFMGLILGFPNIIISLYIAFLTAAIVAIILVIWRKKSFQNGQIAFGPFLAISVFITLIWGNLMWETALRFLGM